MSRPRVVVVGAGPAGLSAAVSLARQGCSVKVFERRAHPDQISSEAEDRAFVVGLNVRGFAAMEQAGFDLSEFGRPHSGIVPLTTFHSRYKSRLPWLRKRETNLSFTMLLGDRMSWVRIMTAQVGCMAREQGLDVSLAFQAGLEAVDFEARTVTVRQQGGERQEVPFDLLVGADGAFSRVRTCLAESGVAGDLQVRLEPNVRLYKVFRGLPAAEFDFVKKASKASSNHTNGTNGAAPADSNSKASANGASGALPPPAAALFHAAAPVDSPFHGFVFMVPRYEDGLLVGTLRMPGPAWEGLQAPADYERLLARFFPSFPAVCVPKVAAQLAERELHPAGTRVSMAAFHGPSTVLIGDAAHAVLPNTGNGMNSGLEDGVMLGQLLARLGSRLEAVPAAFTAARKADMEALLWLDRQGHYRRGWMGRWHPVYLLERVEQAVRRVLRSGVGDAVRPASFNMVQETALPFGQIRRRMLLEDAAVLGLFLGAALWAAASAVAWLGLM